MERTKRSGARRLVWLACVALAGLALVAPAADQARAQAEGGYMGVVLQDLDRNLRDSYEYRGSGGVLVSQVEPGSPADEAGVRSGDIVLRVDGKRVSSSAALTRAVRAHEPGARRSLTHWRDGGERSLEVQLGERPGERREVRIERGPGDDEDKDQDKDEERVGGEDRGESGDQDRDDAEDEDRGGTPTPSHRDMVLRLPEGEWGGAWSMMTRPRLGIEMQDLDRDLGEYFQRPGGRGVLVTRVLDDTPAKRAGLRSGDVIVELDGRTVDDAEDVRRELERKDSGPVRITVLRRGERRTLTAELEERGKGEAREPRMFMRRVQPPTPELRAQTREEIREEMRQLQREMESLRRELETLRRELGERGER
jgi:membrane-associated protease RseP (regulator of RpoE activity)